MSNSSVLEPDRLREALASLTAAEQKRAVEGLELLAQAALSLSKGSK